MDINKLYNVINILTVAGIHQAIIEKKDDGVMLYGADLSEGDDLPSILVISKIDDDTIDKTMGINRVSTMDKRMRLFDADKAKIIFDEGTDFTKRMTIKEGRRKASFTFANPSIINVPLQTVDDEVNNVISMTKDYINDLVKVNQAMSSNFLTIECNGKKISLTLTDESGDTYSDELSPSCDMGFEHRWQTKAVFKILKLSAKYSDTVELRISDMGFMFIDVNGMTFILLPQVD